MNDRVTSKDAVKRFGEHYCSGKPRTNFVAVAYWCDDAWAICASDSRESAVKAANAYLAMWPKTFGEDGMFINGHGAEGFWIMEVPVV